MGSLGLRCASYHMMKYTLLKKTSKTLMLPCTLILLLASCSTMEFEEQVVYLDPALRRVVLFNDTKNFVIRETGAFNDIIEPGEHLMTNVDCYGRVTGLLDVYQVVGRDARGEEILRFYGQRKYSLYVDGKNTMFRGIDLDAYQVFSDSSFHPTGKKEQWIIPGEPCGAGPKMMIRYGR